jgi:transcriptional regulator with XRE-family HTH domain
VPLRKHRQTLGNSIRSYRVRARLTQEKLAEKSDLTPKYLGEVERGLVNISVDALMRIAHALRIRVADLTRDF